MGPGSSAPNSPRLSAHPLYQRGLSGLIYPGKARYLRSASPGKRRAPGAFRALVTTPSGAPNRVMFTDVPGALRLPGLRC